MRCAASPMAGDARSVTVTTSLDLLRCQSRPFFSILPMKTFFKMIRKSIDLLSLYRRRAVSLEDRVQNSNTCKSAPQPLVYGADETPKTPNRAHSMSQDFNCQQFAPKWNSGHPLSICSKMIQNAFSVRVPTMSEPLYVVAMLRPSSDLQCHPPPNLANPCIFIDGLHHWREPSHTIESD